MAKKSGTVKDYSPYLSPNDPPTQQAEPPKPVEPKPVEPKPTKLDTADLARKLLAGVRTRDEEVIKAVLSAIAGASKGG